MSGVRLLELSMSDMLDVLHFLFEDDIGSIVNKEQSDARDLSRETIYSSMYGSTYAYGSSKKPTDFSELDDPLGDDDIPMPVDPFERSGAVAPKPYTPATDFNPDADNPFGRLLDAPLR
jgi:hypothetical protein